MMPKYLILFLLLLCGSSYGAERTTLFAAASLAAPLEQVIARYQQVSGQSVLSTYASSSTLARQLSQGAPGQVFISANPRWMDYLEQQNLLSSGSRQARWGNRLVLAAPTGTDLPALEFNSRLQIEKYLAPQERIAVGDPDHVPVGIYAAEALRFYNLWDQWQARLARTNSARSALALAERGETPLALVYQTDAINSPHLKILSLIDAHAHSPISYEVAVLNGKESPEVEAFYRFLSSAESNNIFSQFGFSLLTKKAD